MPQFLMVYHGGSRPESEEEGARVMAAWGAWMEGLGKALVVPGAPVGMSRMVTRSGVADNGGPNPVSGYSIVEADSHDAAARMAQGCPILDDANGAIEVAEIMPM